MCSSTMPMFNATFSPPVPRPSKNRFCGVGLQSWAYASPVLHHGACSLQSLSEGINLIHKVFSSPQLISLGSRFPPSAIITDNSVTPLPLLPPHQRTPDPAQCPAQTSCPHHCSHEALPPCLTFSCPQEKIKGLL